MFNADYKSVWMSVQSFGFLNLVCWILLECFVGAASPYLCMSMAVLMARKAVAHVFFP